MVVHHQPLGLGLGLDNNKKRPSHAYKRKTVCHPQQQEEGGLIVEYTEVES